MAKWSFLKNIKFKKVNNYFRRLLSLLLVLTALMGTTYAWLKNEMRNSLYSDSYITVSADGLILLTSEGETKDHISLKKISSGLTECTSVDGRNIYFPMSNFDEANNQTYRKATVNDRNDKYISMEFTLSSDKDTEVWISNESYILGAASDAIRISVDFGEDDSSVVILDSSEAEETTTKLPIIGADGQILDADSTQVQVSHSLYRYFYTMESDLSGNPTALVEDKELLTIKAGEMRKITVNVWLEGCDPDCINYCNDGCPENECDCNVYNEKDLQINLKFTVGLNNPKVFMFSDTSVETWTYIKKIENFSYEMFRKIDERRVFLRDKDTGKMYAMSRLKAIEKEINASGNVDRHFYHWSATVPSTVVSVEFVRLYHREGVHFGESEEESDWEFWNAGEIKGNDNIEYRRYFAFEGDSHGKDNSNVGRWAMAASVITVYFLDNVNLSRSEAEISFHADYDYYEYIEGDLRMRMTYVRTLPSGIVIYAARIPATAGSIVFHYGGKTYSSSSGRGTKNAFNAKTGTWSSGSAYPAN